MAIINLTGQAVLKESLNTVTDQMKIALTEQGIYLNKIPANKKIDLIISDKLPVITLAWDLYIYLKKYFGDIPLSKMQRLSGLEITRKVESK